MTACRRDALILEIDMRRGAKRLLQFICPHQRGAAIGGILFTHLFRYGNPHIGLIKFLVGACLAEDGIQVFRLQWLAGSWVQEWQRFIWHHGLDVEIMGRNLGFRQHEFFLFHINTIN